MTQNSRRLEIIIFLVLSVFAIPACPQTAGTGALTGTAKDQSGAVVGSASVTAVNESTGAIRSTQTDTKGAYSIPLLPPGRYRVQVSKPGFKSVNQVGVQVAVTETARLDVELLVGETREVVNVSAEPSMVQTDSAALGRLVDEQAMTNLPLVTRNFTQIIGLSPGTMANVTDATQLGRGNGGVTPDGGTDGTYVNGSRGTDNSYQMDGIEMNDMQGSGNSSGGIAIPNPDTIQEFKVQTGMYDASFGRDAGANVNIVTKSGGNTYHGDVFEYFRNDVLNANDFFAIEAHQPRPALKENQFGFTFGGPIRKEKAFFFTSYQGTRQVNGAAVTADFGCNESLFSPPLTNDRSAAALGRLFGGQSGANGGVAVSPTGYNINPIALALLQAKLPDGSYLFPTPQVVNNGEGFSFFSVPCHFDENQFMTNVDYIISPTSRLSGRFFFANSDENQSFAGGAIFSAGNVPGSPASLANNYRNLSLSHTWVVNSSVVNQARFGFHRNFTLTAAEAPFAFSQFGIAEGAQNNDLPNFYIAGSYQLTSGFPQQFAQNDYALVDSLTIVSGRHSIRFGGNLSRVQDNISQLRAGGGLVFLSFPDFLLGQSAAQNGSPFSNIFASIDVFGEFGRAYRAWMGALYLQDDIKVKPTLTLNLGLRYERMGALKDDLGRNSSFDTVLANPSPPPTGTLDGYVVGSNFKGILPVGVTRSATPFATAGDGQNAFGPRISFSWQVLPHFSRLILRGGFGTYYSLPTGQAFFQNVFGAPFALPRIVQATANANATLAHPFAQPFPTPSSFPLFVPYSPSTANTSFGVAQDFRPAIMQQYTLNAQAQLTRNLLLEVGYVGSRGTHLMFQRSADQALFASASNPVNGITTNTVANIPQREPIPGFAPDSLDQVQSSGASWYNALQVSATKRLSNGLQLLASYTYSDTLDTDGAIVATTAAGNAITLGDQNDPRAGYGRANYSRPHRLVFSYVYALPSPSEGSGWHKRFLRGWSTSGVVTIQAGQWMTLSNVNSNNVFGISEDRAQLAPGCTNGQLVTPGSVRRKLDNYFNLACVGPNISPPVIGNDGIGTAFGDSGVGIVRGPDQNNFDLALMKSTNLGREGMNLEFRAEFFNAFNTPQFSNPDTAVSDGPTFGQISSTAVNPRIIQLALKLNF